MIRRNPRSIPGGSIRYDGEGRPVHEPVLSRRAAAYVEQTVSLWQRLWNSCASDSQIFLSWNPIMFGCLSITIIILFSTLGPKATTRILSIHNASLSMTILPQAPIVISTKEPTEKTKPPKLRQAQSQQQQSQQQSLSVHKITHPVQIRYNFETSERHVIQSGISNHHQGITRPLIYRAQFNTREEEDTDYDNECHVINPNYNLLIPSCSTMHEIDASQGDVVFINCGDDRCAFYLPDSEASPISQHRVVLKTQKYYKDFRPYHLENTKTDGVIMEQATHSPFIMDIYGTCGTSQLLQYSPRGALHDHIKLTRQAGRDSMKPVDKLKILIHIASAVENMHNKSVAAVHGDICCHQFLWVDGIYRLNDFYLSTFLAVDQNNKTCRGQNSYAENEYLWRAPEESETEQYVDLQKVDIWMMAQTMFYVYTNSWLYEGILEEEALKMFHNQILPTFPSGLDTNIPANAAMQSAIQQCWVHKPEERPSAQHVRDFLLQQLSTILGHPVGPNDVDVLRVEIPPLPKNHRFTDSSMETANVKKKERKHIRYRADD